jgi:hypothetical protein
MHAGRLTLLSARMGSLVLLVQAAVDPSMEDWDCFLDHTAAAMAEHHGWCRVIVFTAGGKPDATQRARAFERGWSQSRRSPVAVISDDRLVRGVITVFAWFGLDIRAVRPSRLDEAFLHLELSQEECAWVVAERQRLEHELGLAAPSRRSAQR